MRDHNERKATNGRVNQVINLDGGRTKIVRHETPAKIKRVTTFMEYTKQI